MDVRSSPSKGSSARYHWSSGCPYGRCGTRCLLNAHDHLRPWLGTCNAGVSTPRHLDLTIVSFFCRPWQIQMRSRVDVAVPVLFFRGQTIAHLRRPKKLKVSGSRECLLRWVEYIDFYLGSCTRTNSRLLIWSARASSKAEPVSPTWTRGIRLLSCGSSTHISAHSSDFSASITREVL